MKQDTLVPFRYSNVNLYMLLLGCRPPGRNTEQHDIFFGIGENLRDLVPMIKKFWPETKGNIHIDAWRQVNFVEGYDIAVTKANDSTVTVEKSPELFFINLGGYKVGEFDEFHYKLIIVANDLEEAKTKAKKTAFFKHHSVEKSDYYPNATAHIDDKFGIDIDDAYRLEDILPAVYKEKFALQITPAQRSSENDPLHLGYFRLVDL